MASDRGRKATDSVVNRVFLPSGSADVDRQAPRVRCPIHRVLLLAVCRHCGQASDYQLDAQLLDARFRCRHCRRYYTSSSAAPPLPCTPLARERRIAVTRAAVG